MSAHNRLSLGIVRRNSIETSAQAPLGACALVSRADNPSAIERLDALVAGHDVEAHPPMLPRHWFAEAAVA